LKVRIWTWASARLSVQGGYRPVPASAGDDLDLRLFVLIHRLPHGGTGELLWNTPTSRFAELPLDLLLPALHGEPHGITLLQSSPVEDPVANRGRGVLWEEQPWPSPVAGALRRAAKL
jgi:hypothetical protein